VDWYLLNTPHQLSPFTTDWQSVFSIFELLIPASVLSFKVTLVPRTSRINTLDLIITGVGAGGGGIGPPTFRTGDNPPTFCCNIGKKYQNLLRIAQFLAQNYFLFWGQAPRPQLGRAEPLPRPHPFNLLNIYPPTFNLTPTPLLIIHSLLHSLIVVIYT